MRLTLHPRVTATWIVLFATLSRFVWFCDCLTPQLFYDSNQCRHHERILPLQLTANLQESPVVGDKLSENEQFRELCRISNDGPAELLRIDESPAGIRGMYLNRDVPQGDVVLSIALSNCLTDDQAPDWMESSEGEEIGYFNPSAWVKRLASVLIDQQLKEDQSSEVVQQWLNLLPNPSYLRASLPVYWSDETLQSAKCTALDLLNDSTYFTRASAVQDLVEALEKNEVAPHLNRDTTQRLCENALDVVQTRVCRPHGEEAWGLPIRVLAPVFDFLNHSPDANAGFALEGDAVVVRAVRDIFMDQEVFIDYGESARPAWRCLSSYGFVPDYKSDEEDDEAVAEIYMEGNRYVVGPGTIPEDMVAAAAATIDPGFDPEKEVELTTDVAIHMARRISDAAFQLLLDPTAASTSPSSIDDELPPDDDKGEDFSAEQIMSSKLAASLRWNQHRILMACSMGLRDFAAAPNIMDNLH